MKEDKKDRRKQRQETFEKAAKNESLFDKEKTKIARGHGASNALMVVGSGLELIDADLEGVSSDKHDSFLLLCSVVVPPYDELYIAVYIRTEADIFHERLDNMKRTGLEELTKYEKAKTCSQKNNNTAILINKNDNKLYLRNKGHWNGDEDQIKINDFGPGINVDKVCIAVYPPNRDAVRSLNVRTYISYISKIFGKEKVHEILPWKKIEKDHRQYTVDLASLSTEEVHKRIMDLNSHYQLELIEQLHVAMNYLPSKHFVILSGLSGTGKTNLALKYPLAVHGVKDPEERDPYFFMVRVRPDWTDPTGLIGYHDFISGKYVVPEFLEAVLTAHAHPSIPIFVCIDEMNLARVEYYFSDILSCIESAPESFLTLHHDSVPLEGSNGEDILSSIPFPSNIYVIGTINVDETTNPLSDKVMDRANIIDMTEVDLKGFLENLANSGLFDAVEETSYLILKMEKILKSHGPGFGYRVAKEIVYYYDFAKKNGSLAKEAILDQLLQQKILVKLRGNEQQRDMLIELKRHLKDYPRSTSVIERALSELDDFSGFQVLR